MTLSFVLHNNFLCFVTHSSCVSCLSFCTSIHMTGAVQAHTTCHCPYHKVTAHPHSSPLNSAKTGRYLLATWRHLETRWTWAFSHIRQNESSIFFIILSLYTLHYHVTSFTLSSILLFISLYFCSHMSSISLHSLPPKTHRYLLVIWRCYRNERFMGIFTHRTERLIYFFIILSSNTLLHWATS